MDIVTGAFGFIGKYIAQELLDSDISVKTITSHPDKPNPFGQRVQAFPYHFDDPDALTNSLKGCDCLFNTYWIRFHHQKWSFSEALENTKILFSCAREAGVKKIIHISVTNPCESDPLPYYRGKAIQEELLKASGVPWVIIRPALVYGNEDILVNNIAWTIRNFPVVPIFGDGTYKICPIFAKDLARIAVSHRETTESMVLDAVGPEIFSYEELLRLISQKMGRRNFFPHTPPSLGIWLGKIIGWFVKDVILTKEELAGLMQNKLFSEQPPVGKTCFSEWLHENHHLLGTKYTSEIARHFY